MQSPIRPEVVRRLSQSSMRGCLRFVGAVTCVRHLGPVLEREVRNKYTINQKSKARNGLSRSELSRNTT